MESEAELKAAKVAAMEAIKVTNAALKTLKYSAIRFSKDSVGFFAWLPRNILPQLQAVNDGQAIPLTDEVEVTDEPIVLHRRTA